jgi:hypothetical protein
MGMGILGDCPWAPSEKGFRKGGILLGTLNRSKGNSNQRFAQDLGQYPELPCPVAVQTFQHGCATAARVRFHDAQFVHKDNAAGRDAAKARHGTLEGFVKNRGRCTQIVQTPGMEESARVRGSG